MASDSEKLASGLEGDIQTWEFLADYFERQVAEIDVFDGKKMSGKDYARGLRARILENRELLNKVKKS
jgi:hypothetical protein